MKETQCLDCGVTILKGKITCVACDREREKKQRGADMQRAGSDHDRRAMERERSASTPRQTLGVIACVAGFGAMAYFLLVFDPSVSTAIGRVNNLGLLQDRQNGLIMGGVLAIIGVLLTLFGGRR